MVRIFTAKAKRLVIPLKSVYLPNESHCKISGIGRRLSFELTIISRGMHHLIRKQIWMLRMFFSLQPVKGFRKIKSAKSVILKETLLPTIGNVDQAKVEMLVEFQK
jgi:hypothetical protein